MRAVAGIALALGFTTIQIAFAVEGDSERGARAFRACAACHSLEPNRNMTGPSLSDVWQRKAGSLPSFLRYSDAMKNSGVTWDDKALSAYLQNPAEFMPGNHMTFPGVPDDSTRADIIAFLRQAPRQTADGQDSQRGMGGMMGMQRGVPKLKSVPASGRVNSITYCHDSFKVTTADGKTRDFWERNLRFKTDSSDEGPEKGAPAVVGAGMMGDRASVIFAAPEEISNFIRRVC